ncbi:hypothetical protein N7520_006733 [Penicillium odoratum]|uniref:uncharacterized protein n=1 Tax=Penicillium odoratum TaxID=1167516 RepID=UPI0025479409|nr:uncharacterized protein N7520_006733 [Penicillium odoratum]KAJ5759577.1 hypothetical protein N7520_006733 [Penicillium odoratum]
MSDLSGERHERVYCHACGGVWVKDDDSDGLTCRYCESDFTEIIEIPPDDVRPEPTIPNAALGEDNTDNTADNYGMQSLASPYTSTFTDERPTYTHHTYRSPDGRFTFDTTTTTVRGGTARGLSYSNRSTNAPGNAGAQTSPPSLFRAILQQQMEMEPEPRPRENAGTQTNSPPLYHAMVQQQMEMESGSRPRPHYLPPDVSTGFDRAHLPGGSEGIPQRTWDYYQVPPDNILRFLMGMPLDNNQPGSQSTNAPWDIPMTPMRLLAAVMNRGNAVYTDEEMQQVIANLTDEGPVIPAPGASSTAIQSLPRKRMDRQMLGSDESSECSICMEKVGLGSEVTVLPCSHWFHFDCIEQWLAQTNTCPHCRRSIPTSDSE